MTTILDSEQLAGAVDGQPVIDAESRFEFARLQHASDFARSPELLSTEQIRDGYLQRFGFATNAGYSYDAVVGIPRHQTTDIPVLATSAWFTSTHGHNEHAMRNLMRIGSPVIFVGPEGSFHSIPAGVPRSPLSLQGSAGAVLNFARHAAEERHHLIDGQKRIVIGESRGAMVGMGLLAYESAFDQQVVFADLTAPCFPRGLASRDILRFAGYVLKEPISFARSFSKLAVRQLVHYPATIDPHPYALIHQLAQTGPLFSGEAGELGRQIPKDKLMHITVFNDDFASMYSEWEQIFSNHGNVRITPLEGSHLTIADPETLAYILARNKAFHAALSKPEKVDQVVFDKAHTLLGKI